MGAHRFASYHGGVIALGRVQEYVVVGELGQTTEIGVDRP
jgi:hypothetical protein